jgi:hypothetical protein
MARTIAFVAPHLARGVRYDTLRSGLASPFALVAPGLVYPASSLTSPNCVLEIAGGHKALPYHER